MHSLCKQKKPVLIVWVYPDMGWFKLAVPLLMHCFVQCTSTVVYNAYLLKGIVLSFQNTWETKYSTLAWMASR